MIDLNDYIWKQNTKQRTKFFKCSCDLCGADRGYQEKRADTRPCEICRRKRFGEEVNPLGREASLLVTIGSKRTEEQIEATASKLRGRKHTDEAKTKMSEAAKIRQTKPYKRSIAWRIKMSEIMKGKKHSEETKIKISAKTKNKTGGRVYRPVSKEAKIKHSCSIRGIDIDNFKGFATAGARNQNYHKSIDIRNKCFDRDKHQCKRCKKIGGTMNAHHIESWKFNESLRYEIDNLVTLCRHCHSAFHSTYGGGIKEPNTRQQLVDFLNKKGNSKIIVIAGAHFAGKTTLLNKFTHQVNTLEKDKKRMRGLLNEDLKDDAIIALTHRASWYAEELKTIGHNVKFIYLKVSQEEIDINSIKRRGFKSNQAKRIKRLNSVQNMGRFDFIGNFQECEDYIKKELNLAT
jgi:hypothetical protein